MKLTLLQRVALGIVGATLVDISLTIFESFYNTTYPTFRIILDVLAFGLLFSVFRREISKRERAERNLIASEEQFKTLVQHAGDTIFSTDLKGYYTSINPAVERLMGYKPQELMGHHYLEIMPAAWQEGVQRFYREQIENRIATTYYYFPVVRKDGSEVWIGQTAQLIFDGSEIVGLDVIARDVSIHKRLQDELTRARDAALESTRLKAEFLANMSHEIRTPMNGVLGMTNLLSDTQLDRDQRHFVDSIHQSAEALLHIINGILDFSRIEAGKLKIELEDFDLRLLIEGVMTVFVGAAESKNLEITSIIEAEVPVSLRADPMHLRQILINLLGNAVKFTEQGEVALRVKCLERTQTDVVCRFEISDTGIGMSEAALSRIFESFVQADGSATRRFGGSGLGLSISKQLVEAMGGQIGVTSSPGEGSTFWFTLPAKDPKGSSVATSPSTDLQDLRILVVADLATNREALAKQLKTWQLDVTESETFASAIETLRTATKNGRPFDLALIDHHVEGSDGLDLARAIHQDKEIKTVKLILLSPFGQRPSEETISGAGVLAWVTKPVKQSQLYDCLVNVIQNTSNKSTSELKPTESHGDTNSAMRPLDEALPVNNKLRLLVVEDNPINQEVARYEIEKNGYQVDVAKDGGEALAYLDQNDYALILMDCHMPVMDGFEATARIRERPDHKREVPIIAVTASGTKGEREKCLQAGMNDFLLKPFRKEELSTKISTWLPSISHSTPAGDSSSVVQGLNDRLSELEADYGKEMTLKIVEMIVPDTEVRIERIDRAVKQQDFRELESAAHGLKSGAANVGATELAKLSEKLEDLGEARLIGDAPAILEKLRESWAEVKTELARYH